MKLGNLEGDAEDILKVIREGDESILPYFNIHKKPKPKLAWFITALVVATVCNGSLFVIPSIVTWLSALLMFLALLSLLALVFLTHLIWQNPWLSLIMFVCAVILLGVSTNVLTIKDVIQQSQKAIEHYTEHRDTIVNNKTL